MMLYFPQMMGHVYHRCLTHMRKIYSSRLSTYLTPLKKLRAVNHVSYQISTTHLKKSEMPLHKCNILVYRCFWSDGEPSHNGSLATTHFLKPRARKAPHCRLKTLRGPLAVGRMRPTFAWPFLSEKSLQYLISQNSSVSHN